MDNFLENDKKTPNCPYCGADSKRHSKNPNGKIAYRCTNKKCRGKYGKKKSKNVYFTEKKNFNLTEKEMTCLKAILALIKMEDEKITNKFLRANILSKINRVKISDKTLQELEFEIKVLTKDNINDNNHYKNRTKPISCYNPRVLICQDGNKISLIKFPVHEFKEASTAESHKLQQKISLVNKPPKIK